MEQGRVAFGTSSVCDFSVLADTRLKSPCENSICDVVKYDLNAKDAKAIRKGTQKEALFCDLCV